MSQKLLFSLDNDTQIIIVKKIIRPIDDTFLSSLNIVSKNLLAFFSHRFQYYHQNKKVPQIARLGIELKF